MGGNLIKKYKKKILSSEFNRNALTLVSGTTIAQLLPLAISPILSRMYTADDFGVFALFTSIVMIFTIMGNGRYELAIVLPKKDSYAINIWALTIYIAGFLAFILLIALLFFHDFFVVALKNSDIAGWLYLVPLVVFFLSVYNSFNYLYTRDKEFKQIATVKVIRSVVLSVLQLGLGLVGSGVLALLGGYSAGQATGAAGFSVGVKKRKTLLKKINKPTMIAMAKRYKDFPKFMMPASVFNRLTIELPNIFISSIFNAATLGFYSLSYRSLSAPLSFIGMSIGQVYMKQAAEERQATGLAIKSFKSVFKKIVVIGLPIFTILFFFSEWIFAFVFGEQWAPAGRYAQIITPLLFARFIVAPLSITLSVFERQITNLFLQIGLFVGLVFSFFITWISDFNFINFLYIFVAILTTYYLFFFFVIYRVAQDKWLGNR